MANPSSLWEISFSNPAPFSAVATRRRQWSSLFGGKRLSASAMGRWAGSLQPRSLTAAAPNSNELRQARNGAGDFADDVVPGDLAGIGEDFFSDRRSEERRVGKECR